MLDLIKGNSGISRRRTLRGLGLMGLAGLARPAWAGDAIDLGGSGGPGIRPITTTYPEKGKMIVQRSSPPWLETPFDVFDDGVWTPNDRHFVSWHWATFPGDVDVDRYRLAVRGHVNQPLSLSLHDLLQGLPRFEIAAVSQCAGNSRFFSQPRVPGAQWANGSMGNALYTGVRLKDVLDRAGVKTGATSVRFGGLDDAAMPDAPKFLKSIAVDHARDGEVMIAFAMNGEQLPLLNGFPLKLVVPGWCAVYWIKMLNDIEVLNGPDTNYWTTTGYRVPDVPNYNVKPDGADFRLVPVTRNLPRSFITNVKAGSTIPIIVPQEARGIAFGGDCGVKRVDLSVDGGRNWKEATLGPDQGKYGFRQWSAPFTLDTRGAATLQVRCTNINGESQPDFPIWNPSGYMFNSIESTAVVVA